jgi:catechol 2,3-dioxygenase-like lactoylglutathione lyase family enzyme
MTVRGLHHAGLYVASLERSIAFYRDVFGLGVIEQLTFGTENIAFLYIGSSQLELIEANTAARPAGVVDHIALEVTSLDRLIQHLRERGVTLLDQAPIPVPDLHARIFFCLGPDAERIELLEHYS